MLLYALEMKKGNIDWDLIEGLLAQNNKDRAWLEESLELKPNVVTNWKARGIPRARAASLARLFGVTTDYLLGVSAQIEPASSRIKTPIRGYDEVEPGPDIIGRVRLLPIVGLVQAGPDGLLTIDDYPVGFGDGVIPYWATCDNAYALRVRGESMSPRYLPGEFVAVDPCSEVQPSQEVIVLKVDGTRMIKRLLWQRDGQICFESINKDYKNITLDLEEVLALHRVMGGVPKEAFRQSN